MGCPTAVPAPGLAEARSLGGLSPARGRAAARGLRGLPAAGRDAPRGGRRRAKAIRGRFGINYARGTADPFDLASLPIGVPEQMEAFGRTFAAQGVGGGTRPFVPLLHSSNPRDIGGFVVDAAETPLTWPDRGATAEGVLGATRDAAAAADARDDPIGMADKIRRPLPDPRPAIHPASRHRRAAVAENRVGEGSALPCSGAAGAGPAHRSQFH